MTTTLEQLYEMQRTLDYRIIKDKGLEGQDLLPNTVLAKIVEIAEMSNEWRGFKHWSNNQQPRYERKCHACKGASGFQVGMPDEIEPCGYCNGSGIEARPLLEESTDVLHFFLSAARQLDIKPKELEEENRAIEGFNTTDMLIKTIHNVTMIHLSTTYDGRKVHLLLAFKRFMYILQNHFGFTWDQIVQAYMEKNSENHRRQENGY